MRLRLSSRRSRALLALGAIAVGLVAAGCEPEPPPPPPPPPAPAVCGAPASSYYGAVAVMGPCSQVSVDQMLAWWKAQTRPTYRASVPIDELIALFMFEGQAEGVRGDLAFMQSIIETGWFSFGGRVPPEANNFSGLGATDGTTDYATFPDARTGVRAQIQHLRAYADPTATSCAVPPLHNGCVDPRFHLVSPKGKAPTWNQFGNGVWATDPGYALKILGLYDNLLIRVGLPLA
jgi:hypothetical protein